MTVAADSPAETDGNTLYLDLRSGRVTIEMLPDLAPRHVERIKELVREGFYDGLKFHRVIEGFMAQTGDPRGDGSGGSGQRLRAEFNEESHRRGIVSMARTPNPDGADSQFFILLADRPDLDRQYTVWGRVIDGMEHVDEIKLGDPYRDGLVHNPDIIIRMRMAADIEGD